MFSIDPDTLTVSWDATAVALVRELLTAYPKAQIERGLDTMLRQLAQLHQSGRRDDLWSAFVRLSPEDQAAVRQDIVARAHPPDRAEGA